MNEYTPLMLCEADKTTFHEGATVAHVRMHGSTVYPCSIRMLTRSEHERAGWDTSEYPFAIVA